MAKNKRLDWQQFEEALVEGSTVEELLGLTDKKHQGSCGNDDSQTSNTSQPDSSQNANFFQNLTVDLPDSLLPLKFVWPITDCTSALENKTQNTQESKTTATELDSVVLSLPTIPLECVLPECSSPELDKLLKKELGIKVDSGVNK